MIRRTLRIPLFVAMMFAALSPLKVEAQDSCNAWLGFRLAAGALPPGLQLDKGTGSILGELQAGGRFTFTIEVSNGCSATMRVFTLDVIPFPPRNLVATATSTSGVTLVWDSVPGSPSYEIQRSIDNVNYLHLTTTSLTTADDSLLDANTTYLYRVRATIAGIQPSDFSSVDAATTIVFRGDPLLAGTPIDVRHVTQLRTAVDSMCKAGGVPLAAYTDPNLIAGNQIKAVHITELQTRLAAARDAIGLIVNSYPAITAGMTQPAAGHITALRDGVK